MFIVHLYYSGGRSCFSHTDRHMVRCPDGEGKLFETMESLKRFLIGKRWRLAH